jgi:hypothetical protein
MSDSSFGTGPSVGSDSGPTFGSSGDTRAGVQQVELGTYSSYEDAQRAVDYLSDQGFPVKHVRIIGHGITTVETVLGRMTTGRAALMGAASGAWLGLLVGLLIGLFTPGILWLTLILIALLFGALWGAVFGFVGQWATRGKRDFSSVRALAADRYVVMVDADQHAAAERLLANLR